MNQLKQYLQARQRVLLVGPPGIAKTARLSAVARELGMKLEVMRASLSERVDFGGALVPNMLTGVTQAMPLELLNRLRTTAEPTLLLLDDLGQAPMDVQAAIMKLFDEDELSPQVLICGATNRLGDKAAVTGLCEPLRSRFHLAFSLPTPGSAETADGSVMLGNWEGELDGWVQWALATGVPPEVVAWHRATSGRTLYAWKPSADPALRMPDYRSWETVGRLWNAGIQDNSSIGAAIGKGTAAEFLAFARLANSIPTPDQVFMDPMGAQVPTDMPAMYLCATMVAAAVTSQHADAMLTYVGRVPRVYGALIARDASRRLGAALTGRASWVKWFTANQDLFGA